MSIRALRDSKHNEAIALTKKIIQRQSDHAAAHAVQFSSLFKAKKFEQARKIGPKAAKLNPESVFILNNLACLQLDAKQPAAAAALLKSLIKQFGDRGQWLYNLALTQRMIGHYDYSISVFRQTLDQQPKHHHAAFQLANCLSIVGRHEEAVRAYEYVRLLRSKHAPSHSNYIHHSVSNGHSNLTDLKQELNTWQECFIPKESRFNCVKPNNKEKLKIGFLIGVIPKNWLASIVAPVINQLAQANDSINIYWHDEASINQLFNERVTVSVSYGLSDADFARQVRNDEVDIMIDVCGMRLGNRQRALGLQLAYRQLGWLAHEGLYACPSVELLDRKLKQHRFFVSESKNSGELIAEKTFMAIGAQKGVSHHVIKTWAEILRLSDNWNLQFDSISNSISKTLIERFNKLGVNSKRLIFKTRTKINPGTIVLDNFVHNDPVAACKAISAGGVLVTIKGDLFPATQNAALLNQFKRNEWICSNPSTYITQALALSEGAKSEPVDESQLHESQIHNLGAFVNGFRQALLNSIDNTQS